MLNPIRGNVTSTFEEEGPINPPGSKPVPNYNALRMYRILQRRLSFRILKFDDFVWQSR